MILLISNNIVIERAAFYRICQQQARGIACDPVLLCHVEVKKVAAE